MKTKLFFLAVLSFFLFFLIGCEKDELVVDENQIVDNSIVDQERPESIGEFVPSDDEFFKENLPDNVEAVHKNTKDWMLNIIQNANSPFSIPTYAFRCYDNYKWAYRHVRQPDGRSCSWTSYVICTGDIAAACGRDYSVDVSQVYNVKELCGGSSSITALRNYANSTDYSIIRARNIGLIKSSHNYLDVFKQMMVLLYVNRTPFITIAMSGRYTHYLTIYSVYWKQGIVGSKIYFTDSLDSDRGSFNANVKYMDLWDFYCAMKNNSNSCYNFLELLPR